MSAQRSARARHLVETLELPSSGDVVHARYHVRQELGRGGMAVVLSAYDVVLEREVALKLMLPQLVSSAEAAERFLNEARSLAKIDSPHVVRVLDCGKLVSPASCAGLPFMVLEFLSGEDLYSVAAREGGLPAERVVRYALEACSGLMAAHAQGIVHRDLKPENLFLVREPDGRECLKVLDFGIARSHSRRALTRGKVGLGSPGYMSPEQVQGASKVDARSDVWGLGVVMYELLAHRPVFAGDDAHSLCAQTLNAPVVPLQELRPELPRELTEIVSRCLEREPSRRFGTVEALRQALSSVPVGQGALPELASADFVEIEGDAEPSRVQPRSGRGRRVAAWLIAALILAPSVALLPTVADAPELASARAWSARTLQQAQSAWQRARARAHELWMREPAEPAQR